MKANTLSGQEKRARSKVFVSMTLHPDCLDPLDVFGGKCELFSLEIFFHMLRVGSTGQWQHSDVHGKREDDLCGTGPEPPGNGLHVRISQDVTIGSQQRKALIDDTVRSANLPHLLIPA